MPLFWLSLAFLCGILLSRSLSIPIYGWSLVALTGIILILPPVYRRLSGHFHQDLTRLDKYFKISMPSLVPSFFIFLSIGAIRSQLAQPIINPSIISYYNDQATEYSIVGVIATPPDIRDTYINIRLRTEQVQAVSDLSGGNPAVPVHGLLLARVPASASYSYGDRIRLQGSLISPPENADFSYRDYLANQGIYSYMAYPMTSLLEAGQGNPIYSVLYTFRKHALELVYSIYPDPEASLLAGILLGDQSGISPEVQNAFRLTGTSHVIVISGFNITIIAAFFTLLFSRLLGARRGAFVSAIGIIFYTLLVGANPAVVRAAVLGMLTLLGHQLGRRQVGLNSLAFVAALMAIFTPSILWDVSFQLSFAATLGIMLYAEPFTQWLNQLAARFMTQETAARLAGVIGEYFLLTLAAQLTTLPLMVYYFKRISLTALIANPLILPAQPPLMVLGGLSVLIGLILRPFGQLLAWTAWPFIAYTIRMVEWFSAIPRGSIPLGQVAFPLIILFYAILFILTFARSHISNLVRRLTPAIPLTLMVVTAVMIWKAAFYAPDGLLHATILDIGTGDAVLIQTPTGHYALINGGSSNITLSSALGRRLPPFNRSLDWLIIADIDNEDLSGIAGNLERFLPKDVLWAGNTYGTRAAAELWTEIGDLSIPTTMMEPGQVLELGNGAILKVLSTDPKGAVMLLEWDNFRLLLPMGMDMNALKELQANSTMRNVSALLLAESGYAPVNPPELINQLHPQVALLSVAQADRTGVPSPETIQALTGYNLLRTDENGWIEISTDGEQMWVEVERK